MPIKLFIRVKERIKPDRCSHRITPTYIEITLVKEYEHGTPWHQLEPKEYSATSSIIRSSPPSTHPLSITNTSSIMNSLNRGNIY